MATRTWTGTSAANNVSLAQWGEPNSGDVYNLNGLDGNDSLILNNNGKTSYNTPYQSGGFQIGPAVNGVITITGASSGGTRLTFNLTSVETVVFADRAITLNYGTTPPPPPPPPPSDTTAPVFASATVNGSTLVMNYNEALSTAAPAASALTVSGHTVTGVAVTGQTVTLTLNSPVVNGDVVTVSYSDPTSGNDASAIQDAAGNDAASLVSVAVTNNTPAPPPPPPPAGDTTAPVFTSAAVNGSTLVMNYSDTNNLNAGSPPPASAFSVSGHAVSGVAVNEAAKTVTLTLGTAAINGEVVTVAYTDPTAGNDVNAIQDLAGNDAASLGVTTVTNNTPASGGTTPPPPPPPAGDTTAPIFASATVNGSTLVMSYTDANNLDAAHSPVSGAFTVSGHAVSGVAVNATAKTVSLTLGTAVVSGEAVTVAYTDPTTGNDVNAIQDLAGNDAASFGATIVTNNTPLPVVDTAPPTVISFTPGDGATGVNPASNIVLNFSELVQMGASGTIEIHSGSVNGTLVESFDASVSGSRLTINPTYDLANDTHYFVTLRQGSIIDLAGNGYAGTSTYDFTTTTGADPFASDDSHSESGSGGAVLVGVGAAGILAWAFLF